MSTLESLRDQWHRRDCSDEEFVAALEEENKRLREENEAMKKKLADDWQPRDGRDARIEELEEENAALIASKYVGPDRPDLFARIDTLEEEIWRRMWRTPTAPCLSLLTTQTRKRTCTGLR